MSLSEMSDGQKFIMAMVLFTLAISLLWGAVVLLGVLLKGLRKAGSSLAAAMGPAMKGPLPHWIVFVSCMVGGLGTLGWGIGETVCGSSRSCSVLSASALSSMAKDKNVDVGKFNAAISYAKERDSLYDTRPEETGSLKLGWAMIFGGLGLFFIGFYYATVQTNKFAFK